MRAADGGRALRPGIALGLPAGLVSVAVSACGSLSVKPTAATASVVSGRRGLQLGQEPGFAGSVEPDGEVHEAGVDVA